MAFSFSDPLMELRYYDTNDNSPFAGFQLSSQCIEPYMKLGQINKLIFHSSNIVLQCLQEVMDQNEELKKRLSQADSSINSQTGASEELKTALFRKISIPTSATQDSVVRILVNMFV